MKKRMLTLLLAVVLLLSVSMDARAAEEKFSGTRRVAFTADWSDLENFVNGGRPAFELLLRSHMPEGVSYKMRTQGRDVTLTLTFSFDSLADYEEKSASLTLRTPALICDQEDGLLLIENSTSMELLNFLEKELAAQKTLAEKTLEQIFRLSESRITVNSEDYELSDGVCIHPDGAEPVRMDDLTIHTDAEENGAFTRTITAMVDLNKGTSGDVEELENQFNQVAEARVKRQSGNERTVSVTFEAMSQAELERKTMLCLNVPAFISEQQTPGESRAIRVERTEFLDLEQLLRAEGTFGYTFELPGYCENITVPEGKAQLSGSCVTAENTSFVTCTYERNLQFSSVEIRTDLSSLLGKLRRTIVCTIPTTLAEQYHRTITDKLQLNLCNGSVLDIYDRGGMRYYEISFSSWRVKDVEAFTASVLNSPDYAFELRSGWLPMGKSEIGDSYDMDDMISRTVPADRMTASYVLSKLSFFEKSMAEAENAEISDRTITFQIRSGSGIALSYRQIPVVKSAVLLLALVAVLILAARVVRKVRCFLARLRGEEIPRKPSGRGKKQKAQPEVCFCPYCGERNTTDCRFCNRCGNSLEVFRNLF